jgi:hypothetical protein
MNDARCFLIGSWNVHDLGDSDKCINVRADLLSAKPSLIGLQETKLQSISPAKAASFLPQPLNDFDSVDSLGTSGGLVSAWHPNLFSLVGSVTSRHSLSIDLAFSCDGTPLRFTNVYAL